MSIIQLGTITQLWQNVSDWATGASAIKPKIQIDQTVQGVTNGVSIVGSLANVGNVLAVTTAGTRVQLPNIPCREVTVIARRLNTGYIYAGDVNVSATVFGVELAVKESFTFAVANANQVWIDSSISGGGISYVAI